MSWQVWMSKAPCADSTAPRSGSSMKPGRLKLLALHGYLQNAEIFSQKTGSLRKGLKSIADLCYIDAPYSVVDGDAEAAKEAQGAAEGGRSWWQWTDGGASTRPSLALEYSGVETTVEELKAALREHQPDGIIGFSQGATAASLLLAALANDGTAQDVPVPKFAILVGGFLPRDERFAAVIRESRPQVPSLFVMGEADALVPPQRSLDLMACFASASSYRHPGAHMVPTCSGETKKALVAFLQQHQ